MDLKDLRRSEMHIWLELEYSHREALHASCPPPHQSSGEDDDLLPMGKFGVPDAEGGRDEAELFGARPVGLYGH